MSAPVITTASVTDVGRVRTRNEDNCGEFVSAGGQRLMVVADGMGGHQAGACASQVAVQTVGEVFSDCDLPPDELLYLALETANARIYAMAREDTSLRGMGTTAVAMLFCPDQTAWVAHVGDSRAYRFRNARLEPITRDHSVVAELERQGHLTPEEAAVHPRRNEILRSVGVSATVEVEVAQVDLQVGDQYLLCSDGLSGLVSDPEIARVVEANGIEDAARLLIRMANDAGGPDNITVQIARFGLPEDVPEPVPAAATGAYAVSDPAPPRRDLRRRQMAVVVAAVLVAGIAALTVLWRVYSVSADRRSAAETPAPEESPRPAVPER